MRAPPNPPDRAVTVTTPTMSRQDAASARRSLRRVVPPAARPSARCASRARLVLYDVQYGRYATRAPRSSARARAGRRRLAAWCAPARVALERAKGSSAASRPAGACFSRGPARRAPPPWRTSRRARRRRCSHTAASCCTTRRVACRSRSTHTPACQPYFEVTRAGSRPQELDARVRALREDVKKTRKEFDKTEDDLKALQSVGQIIGEVLRQLDDERCACPPRRPAQPPAAPTRRRALTRAAPAPPRSHRQGVERAALRGWLSHQAGQNQADAGHARGAGHDDADQHARAAARGARPGLAAHLDALAPPLRRGARARAAPC